MKRTGPDRTLESSKIFPYLAWGLIIGFGFFVYQLSIRLQAAAADLAIQTEITEATISIPIKHAEVPKQK